MMLFLLLLLSISTEIGRELCFKLGSHAEVRSGFLADIFASPIVWLGFVFWAIEITTWLVILERAPLSFAFPMMSLCYCGMVLVSRIFLKEPVPLSRWLGAALITAGVAVIGSTGSIG